MVQVVTLSPNPGIEFFFSEYACVRNLSLQPRGEEAEAERTPSSAVT